jgi:hypothetical protein
MGEKRNGYKLLMGMPEGNRLPGRPKCEWIILKWILEREREDGAVWAGLIWPKIGNSGVLL